MRTPTPILKAQVENASLKKWSKVNWFLPLTFWDPHPHEPAEGTTTLPVCWRPEFHTNILMRMCRWLQHKISRQPGFPTTSSNWCLPLLLVHHVDVHHSSSYPMHGIPILLFVFSTFLWWLLSQMQDKTNLMTEDLSQGTVSSQVPTMRPSNETFWMCVFSS